MVIVLLFVFHWYASLFFQSLFNHRYAAHQMFKMSPFWEKVFFVGNWLANGSSYLSANAYGILHRMHHAYADTELDPHSPKYDKNIFAMMMRTRNEYLDVYYRRRPIEERFTKNVPAWDKFDHFAEHIITRVFWAILYIAIYALLATAWWQWLFLPFTIIMGPLHGAIINWFAHKIGYTNFELKDTSKNFLPVDFLMWGESYHNNHHKHGSNPNFGHKWWEIDPMWPIILLLDKIGIIELKQRPAKVKMNLGISFSESDKAKIAAALSNLPQFNAAGRFSPEKKLKQLVNSWQTFVDTDWKGNFSDYVQSLHVREELQVFLENASSSVRKKIHDLVEPADKAFKAKMKPIDPKNLKGMLNFSGKYFWESNSIFQGELA